MNANIKNLIFDVGSVLISYRWQDMLLVDYGMPSDRAYEFGTTVFCDPMWTLFDLGELPTETIVQKYVDKYPKFADDFRWFISHSELMSVPRPKVWDEVHRLKQMGYRIYLLSNYSKEFFEKHTKGASFFDDLDGMMVSYMVHQVKPEEPIYLSLLNKYDLKAEECFFFDDRYDNTETAKRLGIDSFTVESEEHLLAFLKDIK